MKEMYHSDLNAQIIFVAPYLEHIENSVLLYWCNIHECGKTAFESRESYGYISGRGN
jgi:hypothetical protein